MDDDLPPGIHLPGIHPPQQRATPSARDGQEDAIVLSRCWPESDAAPTAGDTLGGSWICLDWANGRCSRGKACEARHQLPTQSDEQRLVYSADGQTHDIFGRERGRAAIVSSAFDPTSSQTIHIESGLPGATQRERRQNMDAFSEWGQVVKTWVLATPGSGFVKFKWRSSAQFAMEAMQRRPLLMDGVTPMVLSWAQTDPSLVQAAQSKQIAMAQMEEAARRRETTGELYARLEAEGKQLKRQRLGLPTATSHAYDHAESVIPDVEPYPEVTPQHEPSQTTTERLLEETEDAAGSYDTSISAGLPNGWHAATDPATGVVYFYHEATGQTQWSRPDQDVLPGTV